MGKRLGKAEISLQKECCRTLSEFIYHSRPRRAGSRLSLLLLYANIQLAVWKHAPSLINESIDFWNSRCGKALCCAEDIMLIYSEGSSWEKIRNGRIENRL